MTTDIEGAARWLAEAVETGNPLAALPEGLAPASLEEAEEIAAAVLESLRITPCGLRVLRGLDVAGPMVEGRLVPSGSPIAAGMLRHGLASAAVVGVLAEALGEGPPVLARVHPAIDLSSTRFTEAPTDRLVVTADLARLGLVVAGRGKPMPEAPVRVAIGPAGHRRRGEAFDLAALFAEAAEVARAWGGLPAGALLVVAGLGDALPASGALRVTVSGLGAAEAVVA
ncbi:hypothetical protein G3576_20120 [Roseomonas stagni]|uniref:4-oxalocrotonate decarboxylase n=1 Tax=Falsiroseomonas algicola TaxID=2716930 RepID=A0A6M1LPL7_9PROT|nr:hypothetical protein [Falsiroseomonas algicola]NGM22335.1 hypothetical protein [Falsiroseomonas algicola]